MATRTKLESVLSTLTIREKRSDPRVDASVLVRVDDGRRPRFYHSHNVSSGGVFLLASQPLVEETHVSLELHLPRFDLPVRASGEVVWKQRQAPAGFAVRFTKISEAARNLLRSLKPMGPASWVAR